MTVAKDPTFSLNSNKNDIWYLHIVNSCIYISASNRNCVNIIGKQIEKSNYVKQIKNILKIKHTSIIFYEVYDIFLFIYKN